MLRNVGFGLGALLLLILCCGCVRVKADDLGGTGTGGMAEKITVSGSTSMEDLMNALGAGFSKQKPGVSVEVQAGGSSVGIANARDGISEIGSSSRSLKESEKAYGLTETGIAIDGIAVAVNPDNPVGNLTKEQLSDIFLGRVTNWRDVGGEDAEIFTIGREAGSGTRDGFEGLLGVKDKTVYVIEANETGFVKMKVTLEKNAIGYLSLGKTDDNVKVLSIDGVIPTKQTVLNGSYTLQRSFLCLTSRDVKRIASDFLMYCLSDDGRKIVEKSGYVGLD